MAVPVAGGAPVTWSNFCTTSVGAASSGEPNVRVIPKAGRAGRRPTEQLVAVCSKTYSGGPKLGEPVRKERLLGSPAGGRSLNSVRAWMRERREGCR